MRALAVLLLLSAAAPAAAAPSIEGIWGLAKGGVGKGAGADCTGVNVIVLREGRYTKAMLDLGTTQGPRDVVVGTAAYTFDGVRLVVAPSLSLAQPEPRQLFNWDPVADVLRREEPAPTLTYRRCPDRPLRPLGS